MTSVAADMDALRREYELRRRLLQMDAVEHFRQFLPYINPQYDRQWFHAEIADYCQRLYEGDIRRLMVFMPPQHGKALDINTPVWTTSGWKRHGDLDFGDYVYGQDGQPKRVLANSGAYLWRCQRVNFASGLTIYAAPEHEWVIKADHDDHKGRVTEMIETQHIFSRRNRRAPYIDRCDKLKFFITSVEEAEPRLMNCIQVEGGMYLAGENMIPTHNSEIVSRQFPAWALGRDPDLKIVGCSYSSDLAQQFSRSIQRTIDADDYRAIFPATGLNGTGADKVKGYLRNVDQFEIVGHRGFYKSVGVGGSLTGTPVDIAIIDDPVKDALEAYSATYRERVWEWYTSVLLTRLHNNSRQLFIMTRWHEDDLAGRILEREADKWHILTIPALRESTADGNDRDPRQVGEALWEARHSLASLTQAKARSPRVFAALYQQRPTIEGGNIVRRDWFKTISAKQFSTMHRNEPMVFFLDTAYTDKTANDPSGIIATCRIGGEVYITHARKVNMKFPDLLRFIPQYVREHGYTNASSIRIEPKANGLSVIDQLREVSRLNVVATPSPSDSKETRLNAASPAVESGRVVLVEGAWNEELIDEVCGFPAKPHDEYVDVLCYALNYHLDNPFKPIDKARTARMIY